MIIAKENISLKEEFLTTPEHLPRIKRDEALKYYNNKLKEFWRENGYEDEATTKRGKREAKRGKEHNYGANRRTYERKAKKENLRAI